MMAQLKRRGLAQGHADWGYVDIAPYLGSLIPQNPDFGVA